MNSKMRKDLKTPAKDTASLALVDEICSMVEETRDSVATTVNAGLSMLYWRIGRRLNDEILKGERAEYG